MTALVNNTAKASALSLLSLSWRRFGDPSFTCQPLANSKGEEASSWYPPTSSQVSEGGHMYSRSPDSSGRLDLGHFEYERIERHLNIPKRTIFLLASRISCYLHLPGGILNRGRRDLSETVLMVPRLSNASSWWLDSSQFIMLTKNSIGLPGTRFCNQHVQFCSTRLRAICPALMMPLRKLEFAQ